MLLFHFISFYLIGFATTLDVGPIYLFWIFVSFKSDAMQLFIRVHLVEIPFAYDWLVNRLQKKREIITMTHTISMNPILSFWYFMKVCARVMFILCSILCSHKCNVYQSHSAHPHLIAQNVFISKLRTSQCFTANNVCVYTICYNLTQFSRWT